MKKDYNRLTTSDMPIDSSFTPQVQSLKDKKTTTTKPKINAVGKNTGKARSTTSAQKFTVKKQETSISGEKLFKANEGLSDLEKLNEESLKKFKFNSKRNKVVIVILSILLAITIATIAIYISISNLETNCRMIVHGVNATFLINDEELSEFRSPPNVQGDSILQVKISLTINEPGEFKVKFTPQCYQKGVLMNNTLIYEHNTALFYNGEDGYCYSKENIQGNQTINLCNGIILDKEYEKTLNVDNFQFEFHVFFEKV